MRGIGTARRHRKAVGSSKIKSRKSKLPRRYPFTKSNAKNESKALLRIKLRKPYSARDLPRSVKSFLIEAIQEISVKNRSDMGFRAPNERS